MNEEVITTRERRKKTKTEKLEKIYSKNGNFIKLNLPLFYFSFESFSPFQHSTTVWTELVV